MPCLLVAIATKYIGVFFLEGGRLKIGLLF